MGFKFTKRLETPAAPDSFKTIQTPAGSSPVADSSTDVLTFTNDDGKIVITGDSATDEIDISLAAGVGVGDVVGPASSTDNAIARFDLATGKLLQNSGVTISDTNVVSGAADPVSAQDLVTKNYHNTNGIDPSKVVYRFWDFIGYNQAAVTDGDEGFIPVTGGTASANVLGGLSLDVTHPGVLRLRPSSATAYAGVFQGACFAYGQGVYTYEILVQLSNLSDGTDTFVALFGNGADFGSTTDFTHGLYFRYTHTASSGNWEFKSANNSVRTTVDTGIAVVAGSWIKLGYIVNAAGTSAQAYINGVAVGTPITTNIPTASNRLSGLNIHIEKSAGTNARDLYVDYLKLQYVFTTPR
jgi:hypothetical protein